MDAIIKAFNLDLGRFATPANTIAKRVFDFLDAERHPARLIKNAEALLKIREMAASSGLQLSEIETRGIVRAISEEGRNERNLEGIVAKALPDIKEDAPAEKVDDDWLHFFIDKCKLVSNEDMQNLWAKLLAGEANSPGAFSKRSLQPASLLDANDANMFTKLCGFAIEIDTTEGWVAEVFIDNYKNDIYKHNKIYYGTLAHLANIDCINFSNVVEFSISSQPQYLTIKYYGKEFKIKFEKEKDNIFDFGLVSLTDIGAELFSICGSVEVSGFYNYLLERFKVKGYTVLSPSTPA